MAIGGAGMGTGLDVNALVSQLIAAERAPTDRRLATVETKTRALISAFGAIRSAVSSVESSLKRYDAEGALPGRKATIEPDAGYSATAGTKARLGTYSISVERLAIAHKLQSAPVAASSHVGHGRLSITVGSDAPINIDIASGAGTLQQIRDSINTAAGSLGVNATVVRGDSGDVLTLASTKLGSAGALTITSSGGDGGLGVFATAGGTMTQVAPAQDARIIVDGVTRTIGANTVADVVDGVSLTLTKAKPGVTFSLEVVTDASPLKASLLTFISSYNTALAQLRGQSAAGGEGKQAGPLSGDSAPRNVMQGLRGALSASYGELTSVGFKTAVDGSLSLDGAKFDTAIAADPEAVKRLLGPDTTLGARLRTSLSGYVGEKGLLTSRTDSLNDRIKSVGSQRAAFDRRIDSMEQTYRRQFSALDAMLSKMQTTSNYLSQQLAALSNQS